MAMSVIWTVMIGAAILCGLLTGQGEQVAVAALEGAAAGVELCFSMAGVLCLWMGVMEVMRQSGLSDGLARLFRPLLRRLLHQGSDLPPVVHAVCHPDLRGAGRYFYKSVFHQKFLLWKNIKYHCL